MSLTIVGQYSYEVCASAWYVLYASVWFEVCSVILYCVSGGTVVDPSSSLPPPLLGLRPLPLQPLSDPLGNLILSCILQSIRVVKLGQNTIDKGYITSSYDCVERSETSFIKQKKLQRLANTLTRTLLITAEREGQVMNQTKPEKITIYLSGKQTIINY